MLSAYPFLQIRRVSKPFLWYNDSMITITMLTKNSAETLGRVLDSVHAFPEIIIIDTGSTDETIAIARRYSNVHLHEHAFTSFGELRNMAAELASNDWIFALDSDEVVTSPDSILSASLKPEHTYSLPYRNFYRGKEITFCGWDKEHHTRLYNKKKTAFTTDKIHEAVIELETDTIPCPIHHYSYRSISDFLVKLDRYTTLFAEQYKGTRRSSLAKALLKSWWAFFRSYILQRGFLGGFEGYLISRYIGETAFYKYLKLREAQCS